MSVRGLARACGWVDITWVAAPDDFDVTALKADPVVALVAGIPRWTLAGGVSGKGRTSGAFEFNAGRASGGKLESAVVGISAIAWDKA